MRHRPGGAFPNQTSVPFDEFTSATRKAHGRKAELLDAFVFGKFDVEGMRTTVRLGNHALTWGESLFFGGNAIAGGMVPVDAVKLSSARMKSSQFIVRDAMKAAMTRRRWASDRRATGTKAILLP